MSAQPPRVGFGAGTGAIAPRFDTPLCAEVDPELFFPDPGGSPAAARRICGACEHKTACLEYAVGVDVIGVWGGTTQGERRKLRRANRITAQPVEIGPARTSKESAA